MIKFLDRKLLFVAALLGCAVPPTVADTITTVAGTGQAEDNGNHGAGLSVNVGSPFGVEIGPDGALYITEVGNHRVLRLDLESGQLKTVAGCGKKGYSGDGGPAVDAELNEPYEVRFDRSGNMFFVEMQNHLVRKVDAKTGRISTVAGTGQLGFSGDNGPALQAQFNRPHSIALDHRGGLYIADIGNHRIRRVDLAAGTVATVAGNGVRELPRQGQPALNTPVLGPRALSIDGDTLWVALREGHSIWKLDLSKMIWQPIAGSGTKGYSGDGGPALEATFDGPKGIAIGPHGLVLVVDTENHAIRAVDSKTGSIRTLAGNGQRGGAGDNGSATAAQMDRPHGVCVAADGTVFVGDTGNHRVRRIEVTK